MAGPGEGYILHGGEFATRLGGNSLRNKCTEESWAPDIKVFILVLSENLMPKPGM